MSEQEYDKLSLFMQLVMTLGTSVMQHLGLMPSPVTGKPDYNLEAAQTTIDMLDMLQKKTQGNLDPEEKKMMDETLTSLKLTYVEISKRGAPPSPSAQPSAPQQQQQQEPPPATADPQKNGEGTISTSAPDTGSSDDQKVRYHKSYG
jgi:hypothetical protein